MDKLRNMRLFCRVVELGSFVKVASDQNVSPTIVGRHIGDLEKSLGARLVNRTTRTMEITDAGKTYYDGCKRLLGQLEALEQSVSDDASALPSGHIRIAAPEGLGAPLLLDAVETFQDLYPDVTVELLLENRPSDIVRETIDIAVRLVTVLEDSSLIVRKLASTRLALLGAPAYIDRNGLPNRISDLKRHDCLHFSTARYGGSWPYLSNGKIKKFSTDWKFVTNQTQTFLDALVRGAGLGLAPMIIARPRIQSGDLKVIDLEEALPEVGVYLALPYRDLTPKRVSLFADHLARRVKLLDR